MATNDGNGTGASAPVKLSFGMAKSAAKKPQTISKPSAFGSTADDKPAAQVDELIKGFKGNEVESLVEKEEKGPLVIPMEENVNWRQQILSKRKKLYVPEQSQEKPIKVTETLTTNAQYGLIVPKRPKRDSSPDQSSAAAAVESEAIVTEEATVETREETLEEQAIRKLELETLGKSATESQPTLSLGQQENIRGDDLEAFQNDLDNLPDEATLDDYEKVPVEEFGAALLRGMGWKGDTNGVSPVLYQQRPALLGLGAKPREPEPVTKKYVKPGETRQPVSSHASEHSSSRSSPLSSSGGSRDRRSETNDRYSDQPRVRDRERDSRSERDRESRRDRSRERYRERDRHGDSGHEREHHRDRDRDRDRDWDRSRRSERSDRERDREYRERDRDRDRDNDRDRDRDRRRERYERDNDRHRDRYR
ncbi:hypothetical protein BGW41_004454 [Actinomortierella wolfii]|nr:hypothetical protein BGW41_004454 [Actinomortierella wolfii]